MFRDQCVWITYGIVSIGHVRKLLYSICTCSISYIFIFFIDLIFILQDTYLETLTASTQRLAAPYADISEHFRALSQEEDRNRHWIERRRLVQSEMKANHRQRERDVVEAEQTLHREARALCQDFADLQDLFRWADFAEEAMQRNILREDAELERKQGWAFSQVVPNLYAYGADWRYREWFAEASGRDAHLGPVGASDAVQPALPEHWRTMSDRHFAQDFLMRGGYESACQTDENGWTALHHAVQTMVYWELGFRVVAGLMSMMPTTWLRAKTWGGRPPSVTALHLAANGSDTAMRKGDLVRLLIEHEADVDAVDDQGRTPFHFAAGTGVVDVAWALVVAGCDVNRVSTDGRNAADRCKGSSGRMCTLMNVLGVLPTGVVVRSRYRPFGHVSESRQVRMSEGAAIGLLGRPQQKYRS